ncbi:MAG: hypothetical protein V7651_11865, partial [Hyphomonas oceanitis]|uniref:hypothetical protein n=1 Tax=Hyphomonas oceanitis TaxID=81033 RepID=UPI0030021E20
KISIFHNVQTGFFSSLLELKGAVRYRHRETLAAHAKLKAETQQLLETERKKTSDQLTEETEAIKARTKDRRKKAYRRRLQKLQLAADDRYEAARLRIEQSLQQFEDSTNFQLYRETMRTVFAETAAINRRLLDELLQRTDYRRTIVLTHERLFRLSDTGTPPLMHVFGHRHAYKHTKFKGTEIVNVAALDHIIGTASLNDGDENQFSLANAGGYCVFTISTDAVSVERRQLFYPGQEINRWEANFRCRGLIADTENYASAVSPYK